MIACDTSFLMSRFVRDANHQRATELVMTTAEPVYLSRSCGIMLNVLKRILQPIRFSIVPYLSDKHISPDFTPTHHSSVTASYYPAAPSQVAASSSRPSTRPSHPPARPSAKAKAPSSRA